LYPISNICRTCNSVELIPSISTIYSATPESIRSNTRIARPPRGGQNNTHVNIILSDLRADCKVKTVNPSTNSGPTQPPKLLDQVAGKMRLLHYSERTESAYVKYSQEFPFITPDLFKLFEEKCDFEDEDDDLEPYERFLLEIKDKPNLVVFNMIDTESSIMIRVGIDMNYCKEEQ